MRTAKIKAVIFDLDDTLYEERHFFHSGFAVVAQHLEHRGIGPRDRTTELLQHFHHCEGRAQVFQKLATRMSFPDDWVPGIVELFRSHRPVIELAEDARQLLPWLRGACHQRLGCVTDGWLAVQRRKIEALKVEPLLDTLIVTDELGRAFWKPHPTPFYTCCARLGVTPGEAIFVGDNPERDMVGARSAGLTSVRIRRPGGYFEMTDFVGIEAQPDYEIQQLTELESWLALRPAGA